LLFISVSVYLHPRSTRKLSLLSFPTRRSSDLDRDAGGAADHRVDDQPCHLDLGRGAGLDPGPAPGVVRHAAEEPDAALPLSDGLDRKSTRLNSSHEWISYDVLCF